MNQIKSQNKPHYTSWTIQEDTALLRGYTICGREWRRIADEFLPNKSIRQIFERYSQHFDPNIDHSSWTQEDLRRLMELGEQYSHRWKFIAEHFFPGRTYMNLKNKYWCLKRSKKRYNDVLSNVTDEPQAKKARLDYAQMNEQERQAVDCLVKFRIGNSAQLTSVQMQDPLELTEGEVKSINERFLADYY